MCQALLSGPAAPVEATKKELARSNAVFSLLHAYFLNRCAAKDIEPQCVATQAELKHFVTEAVTGKLGEIGPEGLSQSEVVGSHRQILSGWRWKVVGHSLVEFLQGKVAVSYDPQAGIPKFTAASEE